MKFSSVLLFILWAAWFILMVLLLVSPAVETGNAASTGANKISFRINGQIQTKENVRAELSHYGSRFYLRIDPDSNRSGRFVFVIEGTKIEEATFEMRDFTSRYIMFSSDSLRCNFSADEYYNGILMIHDYDRTRRRIRGSFEVVGWSQSCDQLVRITDGKFDVTYKEVI